MQSPYKPENTSSHYALQVKIDKTQLPLLKDGGYKLCIAKKVDNSFTVVWKGEDFLENNYFGWTEDYQIFGQLSTKLGDRMNAWTEPQNIRFGQTCVLDSNGLLHPPTGPVNDSGKFYMRNDYGLIHAGVACPLGGKFSPISVSPALVVGTVIELQPSIDLKIWWDLKLHTGSFCRDVSNSIEVSYDAPTTLRAISYEDVSPGLGAWVVDPPITPFLSSEMQVESESGESAKETMVTPGE